MITTNIGNIAIAHEEDWTGNAVISWGDGEVSLPAQILFQLLTDSTNLETASTNLLSEVILLRKDFEILRRQAAAFRTRMEDAIASLSERVITLENG